MSDPRIKRVSNQKPYDLPLGMIAAIAVHALLFVGFTFVFQWKTEPESVYAELWAPEDASGDSLQSDTGKKIEEPDEQETAQKLLEEELAKQKALEEERLAQEKLEQEKLEQERLAEEKRLEEQRLEQERIEQERLAEEQRKEAERLEQERIAEENRLAEEKRLEEERRLAEEKRLEEEQRIAEEKRLEEERRIAEEKRIAEENRKKAEAERKARIARERAEQKRIADEIRRQELARITGAPQRDVDQVGKTTGSPETIRRNTSGTASQEFQARLISCVRQNLFFNVPADISRGQYQTVYRLELLPTGDHAKRQKIKSSGLLAFDDAVFRAIVRCDPIPRIAGQPIPKVLVLSFDPVDED